MKKFLTFIAMFCIAESYANPKEPCTEIKSVLDSTKTNVLDATSKLQASLSAGAGMECLRLLKEKSSLFDRKSYNNKIKRFCSSYLTTLSDVQAFLDTNFDNLEGKFTINPYDTDFNIVTNSEEGLHALLYNTILDVDYLISLVNVGASINIYLIQEDLDELQFEKEKRERLVAAFGVLHDVLKTTSEKMMESLISSIKIGRGSENTCPNIKLSSYEIAK